MKFQSAYILLCLSTLVFPGLMSAQNLSYKNLAPCEAYPKELFRTSPDSILQLRELPQGLYLVRSVSQSFEGQSGEKYFTYQTLVSQKETEKHLCYEGQPNRELKVQTFFPTIIDRTKDQKWGHAFWSLSVATSKTAGAVEANRSLVPGLDYREKLESQGFKVEERQKSHYEYELKLVRTVASWKETIVLLYDQY